MTKVEVVENSSPFFIKFKHQSSIEIVEICKNYLQETELPDLDFFHKKMPLTEASKLVNLLPFDLNINLKRVSLFVTKPGYYYRAHKDGLDHRFSINYAIEILDDKCVTSWYNDDDLKGYSIDYLRGRSRECRDFKKEKHIPLKKMTLKKGESVVFNTEIFHDWDNSLSENRRIVLTLRVMDPGEMYFKHIEKILLS